MPRQRYRILSPGQAKELRCRIDAVRGDQPYTYWCRDRKIYDLRRMTLPMKARLEAAGVSVEGLRDDYDGEARPVATRPGRNPELEVMGRTLRRLRSRMGMTQADLARALYADNSSVSNWEVGWCFLPAERMPELAKVLEVPLLTLYEGLV